MPVTAPFIREDSQRIVSINVKAGEVDTINKYPLLDKLTEVTDTWR